MAWLVRNYDLVIVATWEHLMLTIETVVIALAISLAIGILAARHPLVYRLAVTTTGMFYTIPSLALFALLVPVAGLGRVPALIGLVGYSLLALVRNIVTGLRGVPPEVVEAAVGMGCSRGQILMRVELPLALPVIVAGIRVATVTVIGIGTVAAYVNAGGVGALILSGIQQTNTAKIAAGAVVATAMAWGADYGLERVRRWLAPGAKA
ncbi:MAG: ABC transporter permease [Armatimonadota bacterium]|nr:ABC transporter permease [Armatimonadota bacterium]MDR7548317.1 ABC transporter permease [Armatimonadota bacterium]